MGNLPDTNVTNGKVGLGTIAAAAVVKPILEAALKPIVGDANILSAVTKGAIAVIGSEAIGGTVGNVLGIAEGMDAVEDGLAVLGLGSKVQLLAATNNAAEAF
ncbi:hypothetical protein MsAg5_10300 [Methanosarcinaceae archaeon Ag5]|uniref:Uncharacterized protein n=1 Tax=Methanolapillus africanus TaxID=3028297 RepID=A0AAE4MJM7_9EURY|nr:hypothetical protein [Methanosarcinaceae archaeon Ag5]